MGKPTKEGVDLQVEVQEVPTKPKKENELVSQKPGDSPDKSKVADQAKALKRNDKEIEASKNENPSSPKIKEPANNVKEKNLDVKPATETPTKIEHTKKGNRKELEIKENNNASLSPDKMDSIDAKLTVNDDPKAVEKSKIQNESVDGKKGDPINSCAVEIQIEPVEDAESGRSELNGDNNQTETTEKEEVRKYVVDEQAAKVITGADEKESMNHLEVPRSGSDRRGSAGVKETLEKDRGEIFRKAKDTAFLPARAGKKVARIGINSFREFLCDEWRAFNEERKTKFYDKACFKTKLDFDELAKEWNYSKDNEDHWENQKEKSHEGLKKRNRIFK